MNLSIHWSWNMLLLNCLNHTVLAWFLGGLPQNCQVLPTRARGFHDTTASLGKYRPTVYPILNLSLRGVNIIYPAPGRWSLLGEGASPRRCQCSRGLQGARKLPKAPRTPREKHDMTSNQPNGKEQGSAMVLQWNGLSKRQRPWYAFMLLLISRKKKKKKLS